MDGGHAVMTLRHKIQCPTPVTPEILAVEMGSWYLEVQGSYIQAITIVTSHL